MIILHQFSENHQKGITSKILHLPTFSKQENENNILHNISKEKLAIICQKEKRSFWTER